MQPFFLIRFGAFATTVDVIYGGITSTRTRTSSAPPPASLVVTSAAALHLSVPIAFDISSQSKAISTVSDVNLPTSHSTVPDSIALTNPILCSASCPVCNVFSINGETETPSAPKMTIDSLGERTLNTPGNENNNDIERFLLTEYGFAEFVRLIPKWLSGYSSGFGRKLLRNKYNAAVGGLTGCTSVIVVSQSAIWISHFWEIPSFRDYGTVGLSQRRTARDIANFQDHVLHQMENGGLHLPGLRQFTAEGGYFGAAEDPRWIIVTPRHAAGFQGELQYDPEVTDMVRLLRNLFPNAPPVIIDYIRKTRRQLQNNAAAGKLLVQYDPFEDVPPNPSNPCETHQRSIIRLWVQDERQPVYELKWTAKSEQLVSENWRTCPLPSALPQAQRAMNGPSLVAGQASSLDAVPGSEVLADPRNLQAT